MDDKIIKFLSKIEFSNFLDVGAGNGIRLEKIMRYHPSVKVRAVEISPLMFKELKKKNIEAVLVDARSISFKADSFDVVHCSHLIEHFQYPDICKVLEELVRVARPGGYIIIRTPMISKKFYADLDHIKPYPPAAILNYFSLDYQAQKVSNYRIKLIKVWYGYGPISLVDHYYAGSNIFLKGFNKIFDILFNKIGFPRTWNPTEYIMILKKI